MTQGTPPGWHPNQRYEHAFAIVRIDLFHEPFDPLVGTNVTKVVWSQEAAQLEVDRLNRVNHDKNVIYFAQITRVERARPEGAA